MSEIVAVQDHAGEARADTRQLAARMGNQHKNLLSLLDDYHADFQALGAIAFETRPAPTGGKPIRVAFLNEEQCYFLLTLVRNTEITVPMKRELVEVFTQFRRGTLPTPAAAPALPAAVGMDFLQQFAGNVLVAIQQQASTTKDEVKAELRLEFTQAIGDRPISGSQPLQIQKRIRILAGLMGGTPAHYAEAWRRLKSRYGVAAYRDLTVAQFDDVIKFLDLQIASYRTGDLFEGGDQQ